MGLYTKNNHAGECQQQAAACLLACLLACQFSLQSWSLELTVTSEYSGRAAVFREELQSYRRTDPAILEDRQPVKIQCEDSASVIVNCSEL
jgi:hypothetical protein